jgi:hypothetical protein
MTTRGRIAQPLQPLFFLLLFSTSKEYIKIFKTPSAKRVLHCFMDLLN